MKKLIFSLILLSIVFIAGCNSGYNPKQVNQEQVGVVEISQEDKQEITEENGVKYLINPNEFRSGGPGKGGIGTSGGIPSLLDPKFLNAEEATYLKDQDLVLGLEYKGESRAYPYGILVWHEMVNDIVQGDSILVTYCPLCFTGVAFKADINGQRELFGVSGKLYNSELVMYDQSTDSYWPQSLGKAVVGPRTGLVLEKIPIDVAKWGDWKRAHPFTKVLSQDTGFVRSYGSNPYGDANDFSDIGIRLGVSNPDPRLPPQTIVYGIELNDNFKAYEDTKIRSIKVINDKIGDVSILMLLDQQLGSPKAFIREVNNKILTFELKNDNFVDKETNTIWDSNGNAISGELQGTKLKRIVHQPIFWFAWAAFYPETQLFS